MGECDAWMLGIAQSFDIELEKVQMLEDYLIHIIEANKKINLTRIETLESGRLLHLEDSLTALPEFRNAPDGLYGDLGTGGGFPGVPLSIATGRETLLIDSVKKKMNILGDVLVDMNLQDQISCYGGRIEDLSLEKKASFAVLTARALSSLPSLMELACPLLRQEGRLICYKANIDPNEMDHAVELKDKLALKLIGDRTLTLSDKETTRRILVFEKKGYPSEKLPRRSGMAQKKPF